MGKSLVSCFFSETQCSFGPDPQQEGDVLFVLYQGHVPDILGRYAYFRLRKAHCPSSENYGLRLQGSLVAAVYRLLSAGQASSANSTHALISSSPVGNGVDASSYY